MKSRSFCRPNNKPKGHSGLPVPRWYLRYLWLSGLFFMGKSKSSSHELDTASLQSLGITQTSAGSLYSYIVALLTTILAILTQVDYYGYFWEDIATLDFFVLVRLINNNALGYQVPLIFVSLIISREATVEFFTSLHQTVHVIFNKEEVARFRKYCSRVLCAFILTFLIVAVVGLVPHQWSRLSDFRSVILGHQNMSGYADLAFTLLTISACLNVDLASQTMCAVFVIVIALGFVKVRHTIEVSYHIVVPAEELATVVKKATICLQKLRNLTFDFNEAFGLLILVQCVRDLVAVVSFIALMLRYDGRLRDETRESFEVRRTGMERNNLWDYVFISITLTKSILRISACLHCNRSVKKITRLLQKTETEVNNGDVKSACSEMLSKIDQSTGTISAGGFTVVNMEYVAQVFSALVAYAVLVYQARDSKVAAQDLAKVETVRRETDALKELIRSQYENISRLLVRLMPYQE